MIAPIYTITTPIGEECHHLNFFTNLEIDSQTSIGGIMFITPTDKNSFWLKESDWIKIQREIKINKLIK